MTWVPEKQRTEESACGHELANVSSPRIRKLTENRKAADSYLAKYIHKNTYDKLNEQLFPKQVVIYLP